MKHILWLVIHGRFLRAWYVLHELVAPLGYEDESGFHLGHEPVKH